MVARLAAAALAAATLLAGCGPSRDNPETASLLLDFTPNGVHGGIYNATTGSIDRDEGLLLRVRTPGSATDAVKLLRAGRTDFAVLDIHDLGIAREKGADVVGVFALVQRPLAAVIARRGIRRPRDLEGERAGVTGLPSDDAVLRAVVRGDGGRSGRVRKITVGFNAVGALLAGRIDAATAFWNAEGVALRRRRPGRFREFRVDEYGAPRYPELVVAATRETVETRAELVGRLRRTLARGYRDAVHRPARTLDNMRAAIPGLDLDLTRAQLAALRPAFQPVGRLDRAAISAWAAWDVRYGILDRRPDVDRAFAF
ncbi:MAG TPA: ABC transporter substrate-binding protein [Solirubrobacteraceae bacterium]|nr:ABC transporter substrate-binding protein [Solirubrobacteraceae bacterium]